MKIYYKKTKGKKMPEPIIYLIKIIDLGRTQSGWK
jgi:hypothetical protein